MHLLLVYLLLVLQVQDPTHWSSHSGLQQAIYFSIFPVLNALLVVVMVASIYGIFGVYLFSPRSSEHFGTFMRAAHTLFMLTAFDDWPDALPSLRDRGSGNYEVDAVVWLYVVTYTAVVSWTLLGVVVAVMLDNFMIATATAKAHKAKKCRRETKTITTKPLDGLVGPLLVSVDTEPELRSTIESIFRIIDVDDAGVVTYEELRDGLLLLLLGRTTTSCSLCDVGG